MKRIILLLVLVFVMAGCVNQGPDIDGGHSGGGTIDENGRENVVQHAHPFQTAVHFHVEDLNSPGTYRYVLIDKSNTTFFPGQNISYIHLEWLELQIDSNVNGDYQINFIFIENVTATNSTRYVIKHFDGSKTSGQQLEVFINPYPNGWRLANEDIRTHGKNIEYIYYNTTSPIMSYINPYNATVIPGDGDLIMEIQLNAGQINSAADLGYHPDGAGTD